MIKITETVKHLIIINVLVYIASMVFLGPGMLNGDTLWDNGRYALALYFPTSEYFQPFQILSHMFMHAEDVKGGWMSIHLLFNMLGIYMFGSALESIWGAKKFLSFYFICGFGAMIVHMLVMALEMYVLHSLPLAYVNGPVLGASGALYGILVGFGMMFPNAKLALIFFPVPIKAKYFIPGLLALDLFSGLTGFSIFGGGIAHFAHIGGAIFGFLMVMYWRKNDDTYRWN